MWRDALLVQIVVVNIMSAIFFADMWPTLGTRIGQVGGTGSISKNMLLRLSGSTTSASPLCPAPMTSSLRLRKTFHDSMAGVPHAASFVAAVLVVVAHVVTGGKVSVW